MRIPAIHLALLMCSAAAAYGAQGNGITIRDLTGSAQTNRTFTISRVFKAGDITQFPQARVGGTRLLTQADVKSRWPDGSVKHVLISFTTNLPASTHLDVDFLNQSSCHCGTAS